VQWRVMVEVSGALGAKQVHEVHTGCSATPGCSAATLGLSLAEAKAVQAGLQRPLFRRKPRSIARSATLPWGKAVAEGSAASAAAIVAHYGGGPRFAV
jgi:hypothetical protein